jgi:glycosyltransferase involved in cell wall biosynthesis
MEYPLMQQGGTEVLVRELLRGLSPHFEIILVSGDRNQSELPDEFNELIAGHLSWQCEKATVEAARTLAKDLQSQVSLAHFHLGGTYEWQSNRFGACPIYHLARSGVPCLTTNHLVMEWLKCGVHPGRSLPYKVLAQIYAWLSRARLYRHLCLEICVSQHDRARLVRMYPFFQHKIIQRYHSLLPDETSAPRSADREHVILCVGAIGGRKAQINLVRAFAPIASRHSQWRVELVGRIGVRTDYQQIQDYIKRERLCGRVELVGHLSDAETVRRMQSASILAMPSLQEGLGLSLQEGLFYGCVGVGSRVGGIPELIEDQINGLLTPPGDMTALTSALDRLMGDPGLLERLRKQSRSSILRKGMTAVAMVQSYLEMYDTFFNLRAA